MIYRGYVSGTLAVFMGIVMLTCAASNAVAIRGVVGRNGADRIGG